MVCWKGRELLKSFHIVLQESGIHSNRCNGVGQLKQFLPFLPQYRILFTTAYLDTRYSLTVFLKQGRRYTVFIIPEYLKISNTARGHVCRGSGYLFGRIRRSDMTFVVCTVIPSCSKRETKQCNECRRIPFFFSSRLCKTYEEIKRRSV